MNTLDTLFRALVIPVFIASLTAALCFRTARIPALEQFPCRSLYIWCPERRLARGVLFAAAAAGIAGFRGNQLVETTAECN